MTAFYAPGRIRIQMNGGRDEDRVSLYVHIEPSDNKWRRIYGAIAFIVAAVIIIAVAIRLSYQPQTFSKRFISKCLEYKRIYKKEINESYCQRVFDVFERAYIGKPESNVSMEDYDDLIAMVPFDHPCNQTMFWSQMKELVHKYTKDKGRKDCFTLEDTLLGYTLNNETWCGKEGSNETFTDGCKGFDSSGNTSVISFWNRASVAFAEYACENATVMLDGSLETPFDPNSTFARFEIKRLKHPKVTKLNVILISGDKFVSCCTADNLKIDLKNALDSNILYSCNEVTEFQVTECFVDRTFSDRFIKKCQEKKNNKSYCQRVFDVFAQAYIGKPKSKVSMEDYDDLIAMVPFDHPCNQTMFWSQTKKLVHKYTDKVNGRKDCFTLEDTLLGYILDNETWCGKEGSDETFTGEFCQECNSNVNTAFDSFWNRISVAFAEYACENATVMLDGSQKTPFNHSSTFARFEINQLKHPKVTKLNVILISGDKFVSRCTAVNLEIDLKKYVLGQNITYSCYEVTESQVTKLSSSHTDVGCAACLLKPAE